MRIGEVAYVRRVDRITFSQALMEKQGTYLEDPLGQGHLDSM
jgi:hypothetical protein